MYLDVYWRNNGSIVNVNIIQRVSNKSILYKVTCGGRAGAFPEWTLLQVCVYLDGSNVGQNFTAGYTLSNYVCKKKKKKKKKKKIFFFLQNR